MPEPTDLIGHWGYAAIFFLVFLGNLGLPVPEESVLLLAGFLVWKGQLQFLLSSMIGIFAAVSGDNVGYWIGHTYGARVASRYRQWLLIHEDYGATVRACIVRYGVAAVFIARFLPGIRFMVGPVAGTARMPFNRFFAANFVAALIYIPLMLAGGYAMSLGMDNYLNQFEEIYGHVEYIGGVIILLGALIILAWRFFKAQMRLSKYNNR